MSTHKTTKQHELELHTEHKQSVLRAGLWLNRGRKIWPTPVPLRCGLPNEEAITNEAAPKLGCLFSYHLGHQDLQPRETQEFALVSNPYDEISACGRDSSLANFNAVLFVHTGGIVNIDADANANKMLCILAPGVRLQEY